MNESISQNNAPATCNRSEDLAEKTLTLSAGILIGMILSKIVY